MVLIAWLVAGALMGWVASALARTNHLQGMLANILLGMLGAFLGGTAYGFLTDNAFTFSWNVGSLLIAILGAMAVSWGFALLNQKHD